MTRLIIVDRPHITCWNVSIDHRHTSTAICDDDDTYDEDNNDDDDSIVIK